MPSIFLSASHVINLLIFHNNPSRDIILFVRSCFLDKVAEAQCLMPCPRLHNWEGEDFKYQTRPTTPEALTLNHLP